MQIKKVEIVLAVFNKKEVSLLLQLLTNVSNNYLRSNCGFEDLQIDKIDTLTDELSVLKDSL